MPERLHTHTVLTLNSVTARSGMVGHFLKG